MNQALQEPPIDASTPEKSNETERRKSSERPALAYRLRGVFVAIPLVASLFITWHQQESSVRLWVVAGIVFMAGLLIRIWAQQYLHFRLRMNMMLTTGGPYSLVRNPIYIGNTLICLGVTIASRVLWMVPVTLLVCIASFPFVVRYEESYLTARYGEPYVEYTKRVPRWVPNFRNGVKNLWAPHYLGASIKTELYNLAFLVPVIIKAYLAR